MGRVVHLPKPLKPPDFLTFGVGSSAQASGRSGRPACPSVQGKTAAFSPNR